MTVIYAVAQQKGGVGKTTTAINVAATLAARGSRVLAVDIDPQFALTRQLGLNSAEMPISLVDVLTGHVDAVDAIVHDVHGLDVLPGHRDLRSVELTLASQIARDTFLRRALEDVAGQYDAVVIDTPPNLGLLTVNALVPADVVLAPVSAEDEGSAQGVAELRAIFPQLAELRGGTQPRLVVLLTRWHEHRVMAELVVQAIEARDFELAARIPSRVAVQQAAAWRQPVVLSDPDSDSSRAYGDLVTTLTNEVIT